ncbi:putative uncharacterized protein [Roseburia inulinivorans CAG:15]|nr:putative uncharacterized protein [Roseburia inulinivorans CAG:15]
MQKQLEQYFGCKVKIAEYKNKLPLPIFMTMRDIMIVEIYGVNFAIIDVMKETELSVAAMKKQKAKYEEALQCPVAYEVALNNVSMRNALVKSGVPFVNLPGNVFLPFMGIVLQDVYRKQLVKELPIFMTMRDILMVEIYGVNFAIIDVVKETELSVAAMKKQKAKYEEALQCPVAYEVALNNVSMRNALVKSGVPFVNLPGNVFLPFMGIVLQDVYRKQLVKADKMMPATQMVFLELLYMSDEESVLKSEVANKLNLTKTSITRATAQLEEMGLIQQMKSGTEIAIKRNYSRKEYYENAKGYLINPVQKVITIMRYEATFESFSAGETALSQESELNPPRIEERAIYKGEEVVDQLEIVDARSEDPDDCLKIQLWKYNPSYFAREGCVDPVSLACTFKGNEDERIEMSVEKLLED